MSSITFDRQTVNQALQNKYSLPTYQRDYKWTNKQFRELLTDFQEAFLNNYKPEHGRKDVGAYEDYFLGTIITTSNDEGVKSIIDGQQRLTTLTLILAWFQRVKLTDPNSSLTDLDNLIRRELYGEKDYNLSFEEPRSQLFNTLLNGDISEKDISSNVESIKELDLSAKRLFDLFISLEDYIDDQILQEELLPFFADYIVNKVLLFEIGVPSEQDAHRVFVTMNDRGLKLSPIDLLKGYLLSNIHDDQANAESHEYWVTTIQSLKKLSPEEDSQFLKTWLRSQFAETIRGKKRGDSPGDFEIIGDSYHRWMIENREYLGLNNSDDFQQLISETIPFYAKIYDKVKVSELEWQDAFPHLFYNGSKNLTLQSMVILASIKIGDTTADVNKKIKLVSLFLDYFTTCRTVNGKGNTYDNVRDPLFALTKKIRGLDVDGLRDTLKKEATKYETIKNIEKLSYGNTKRQDILHILGRIGEFLEGICAQTNAVGFIGYIDRSLGNKTFDIEHVLSELIEEVRADLKDDWDFSSDSQYNSKRNLIGGLILLPRGRNRSLKAKAYSQKVGVYGTENILCQSLSIPFFENNPSAQEGLKAANIDIEPIEKFGYNAIEKRGEFYKKIAENIWSISNLDKI